MARNIAPFDIAFSSERIEDLNQRLRNARIPELIDESPWERGPPAQDIRRIVDHWHSSFHWSDFQEKLNRLPNFEATVSVDGFKDVKLHFLHQKSSVSTATPLLLIHGWPGHYYELSKVLPLLAEASPEFHVVIPSLPNFGFSSRITKPGFGLKQYAETCHKLMQGLGYEQYATQGGDWGSFIGRKMAVLYPQSLRALHLNLICAPPPPITAPVAFLRFLTTHLLNRYTPQEVLGLQQAQDYQANGNGYLEIQKQRPDTIGAALEDSPVALLTWIYDKLVSWTDDYPWTDDEICEWVSIYWFSRAGPAASVVIYHEAFKEEGSASGASIYAPGTKVGFSHFPKEVSRTPDFWNRQIGDVVFEREHERGGHFAAWEQPEALANDLREMLVPGGAAYGAFKK